MAGASGSWGGATGSWDTPPAPIPDWTPPPATTTPPPATTTPPPTPDNWSWSPPPSPPPQRQALPPVPPVNRPLLPTTDNFTPPQPQRGLPRWRLLSPAQQQRVQFGAASNIISWYEDQYRNIPQQIVPQSVSTASGYFQITDSTWREFAPQVGADRWARAMDAPPQVQYAVAQRIPLARWDANPAAIRAVLQQFPWANQSMTLGQIDATAALAPRQRYIMATANRAPNEWFRMPELSDQYRGPGYLPGPQDVSQVMAQARTLLPMLSQNVALPTSLMVNSFQGYQRASMAGQLLDMLLHRENWKKNLEDSLERMEEEGMDVSSAFAAYGPDPNNPKKAFDEQRFSAAMTQVANKWNDGVLRDIVNNPDAVERLMQARDRFYLNASKTNTADEAARTKAYVEHEQAATAYERARTAGEQNPYVQQPQGAPGAPSSGAGAAGGAVGAGAAEAGTGGQQAAAEPTPPESPPPTEEPGNTTGTAAPSPDQQTAATPTSSGATQLAAAPPDTVPDVQPDSGGAVTADAGPPLAPGTVAAPEQSTYQMGPSMQRLTPEGRRLATGLLTDPDALKNVPEKYRMPIVDANTELQEQVRDVLAGARSGRIASNDVIPDLRSINETLGDTLQAVIDAKRVVPGSAFGGGSAAMSPFWSTMSDLASIVKPGWNPNNVMAARQFMDPNGRTQFTLRRAGTMARTAVNVLKDLNAIRDDPKDFFTRMTEAISSKGLKGRPEYTNLYNDWQAFVQEDQAVRAGAASVTETEEQLRTVFSPLVPGSKAQIRGAVIHNIQTASEAIRMMRDLWGQYGVASNGLPDQMYGDHPDVDAAIESFDRMNQDTGIISGPVPSMMKDTQPYTGVETR